MLQTNFSINFWFILILRVRGQTVGKYLKSAISLSIALLTPVNRSAWQ